MVDKQIKNVMNMLMEKQNVTNDDAPDGSDMQHNP
jgi:hypothetical protein